MAFGALALKDGVAAARIAGQRQRVRVTGQDLLTILRDALGGEQFAGAAAQLSDAVLVNPYSPEEMSDAIARALKMPLAERKARWEKLIDNVRKEDVMWWCELFITALEDAPEHVEA